MKIDDRIVALTQSGMSLRDVLKTIEKISQVKTFSPDKALDLMMEDNEYKPLFTKEIYDEMEDKDIWY